MTSKKRILSIIPFIFIFIFLGCRDHEDPEFFYSVFFKNTSSEVVELTLRNDPINENNPPIILLPGEISNRYEQIDINHEFEGFRGKLFLTIKFSNGKGYSCNAYTDTGLCFVNKESPYSRNSKNDYIEIKPNNFVYEITQSDFENAHDLP